MTIYTVQYENNNIQRMYMALPVAKRIRTIVYLTIIETFVNQQWMYRSS
jgi:hypothetical protein